MNNSVLTSVPAFFSLVLALLLGSAASSAAPFNADASLVEIEVTKKSYDYTTPWNVRNAQIRKNGVVVDQGLILTTADGLSNQYLCRVRKGGISKQYAARVDWVDYYSNIALLRVEDESFWEGMRPVALIDSIPASGDLDVFRWSSGRIEKRAAEIIRLFVGDSKMSYIEHLQLSAASDMDSAGWAEVVVSDGKLVGLTSSATKERLVILPAPLIQAVLQHKEREGADAKSALGYFDFDWMPATNPALLESKGFQGKEIGVVVTAVGKRRLSEDSLEPGDVILEIDGFVVDSEGKYLDPDYGRLRIDGLATRAHYAGDSVPVKLWRDGKELSIDYQIPHPDFEKSLIPDQRYDQAPKYLVAGGLVFQPLDGPFVRALGNNTPFLLDYYKNAADLDRSGLVLLTNVLPDDFNRGYESLRLLIVDQINSMPINSLEDVATSLSASEDGFHRIRFTHDSSRRHLVLDATDLDAATRRILKHYRITNAAVF
jgi:hypothetical protein